jgi:hypothetical protein
LIGAFDIISEFLPHVAIILYRVYPTSHALLQKTFKVACVTTVIGTIAETILTMFLFGTLWSRWTIAFKITTPMLHALFASAQLWGSWVFYNMYKKQGRILASKRGELDDLEVQPKIEEESEGTRTETDTVASRVGSGGYSTSVSSRTGVVNAAL